MFLNFSCKWKIWNYWFKFKFIINPVLKRNNIFSILWMNISSTSFEKHCFVFFYFQENFLLLYWQKNDFAFIAEKDLSNQWNVTVRCLLTLFSFHCLQHAKSSCFDICIWNTKLKRKKIENKEFIKRLSGVLK